MLTPTALPLTVMSLDRGRKVEHPEVTVFRTDLDFFYGRRLLCVHASKGGTHTLLYELNAYVFAKPFCD